MYLSLVVPPCLYLRLYLQADSLYNLRRPYDLVALLRQEQRAVMLENLRTELLNRKEEIDRDEDKNTGACACVCVCVCDVCVCVCPCQI